MVITATSRLCLLLGCGWTKSRRRLAAVCICFLLLFYRGNGSDSVRCAIMLVGPPFELAIRVHWATLAAFLLFQMMHCSIQHIQRLTIWLTQFLVVTPLCILFYCSNYLPFQPWHHDWHHSLIGYEGKSPKWCRLSVSIIMKEQCPGRPRKNSTRLTILTLSGPVSLVHKVKGAYASFQLKVDSNDA